MSAMCSMMKLANRRAVALLAAISVLVLSGCGGAEEEPPSAPADAKTVIAVCQSRLDDPWRVQMNVDIKAAAAEHPEWQLELRDAAGEAVKQREQVEGFISEKVALLVVSPVSSQDLTPPVASAMRAGIPSVVLHEPLIGDQYTCFVEADNYGIGYAAGEWLAEKLGGRGGIVELKGPADAQPGKGRHEGFRAAIRKHPGLRVLYEYPTKPEEAAARKEMATALTVFDKIDAVFAHNDVAAYGACLAAEEAGRRADMLLVGIGGLPDKGQSYVRQGKLDASFEYPTGGSEAIELALSILGGKEVSKNVVLGSRFFTSENVDAGGEPAATSSP